VDKEIFFSNYETSNQYVTPECRQIYFYETDMKMLVYFYLVGFTDVLKINFFDILLPSLALSPFIAEWVLKIIGFDGCLHLNTVQV
jgi:hypothetical protein